MAYGWGGSPVDYRDDEFELVEDGEDLGMVDLGDHRWLDAD